MEEGVASRTTVLLIITLLIIGTFVATMLLLPNPPGSSFAGLLLFTPGTAPIDPSGIGFGSLSRSNNYEELVNSLYANGNVTTAVNNKLWVPWFSTSTSCAITDLKSGASCNSGETIDFTHNCMVTDEFSQVGIMVSMAQNQTRMDQFFNTVITINSSYGRIPAWRVYRSGTTIDQCRSGINGNCDTASDATARIIIALYTASNNTAFSGAQRALYRELATNLSAAFLHYEVLQTCTQSSLGYGQICYWMSAGSGAKSGGFSATDFAYTGYYSDGIIAMLAACGQTGNQTYCAAAGNFTLNYLEAAKFNGVTFTAPPGRSFKWVNTSAGQTPAASCTNTCGPDQWDYADASRATGLCSANYYAALVNVTLPGLQQYCNIWGNRFMNSTSSAPIQYFSNGSISGSSQSGFLAQGLEALFQLGGHNQALFQGTLDNALAHYSTNRKTWDNTACFGVYTETFAVRALGAGIGRDIAAYPLLSLLANISNVTENVSNDSNISNVSLPLNISFLSTSPANTISINTSSNRTFTITLNSTNTTITTWFVNTTNQTVAFNASSFTYVANASTSGMWNITVSVWSATNRIANTWMLNVSSLNITNISSNISVNITNNTNQTNATNTTNTTTNTSNTSPPPSSSSSSGGGGGGGGAPLPPKTKTTDNTAPSIADVRSIVKSYFTQKNVTPEIIVTTLQTYYNSEATS